jgi:putative ATP-dependent endonuclease of OLD family
MQITDIKIHNFRSIADCDLTLGDYGLLIGPNNSGKSNVVDALRVFYEHISFIPATDIPKFKTDDDENWIDIVFSLNDQEYADLKDEYRRPENKLKVRKYLRTSEKGEDGKPKKGIYGFEGDKISDTHFYGEKNVQQGKVGDIIYIPAVSTLDEQAKFSGPSPLRDLLTDIFKKLIGSSESFSRLMAEFEDFSNTFKSEETPDGQSLKGLEGEINTDLEAWDATIRFNVDPVDDKHIIKYLLSYEIEETQLKEEIDAKLCGEGFQRHLIYTIIRLAAKYKTAPQPSRKKEFTPSMTLLVFEEPEAFLHPPQQLILCRSLRAICAEEGKQVLASSHSPYFVSQNSADLPSLTRLCRVNGKTGMGQIQRETLSGIFSDNQKINDAVKGTRYEAEAPDLLEDMEAVKYFLWLNPERCGMFFAQHVMLVEGCTERVVFNYLVDTNQIEVPRGGLFILDCLGKFNVHRFMNILGPYHIPHSILIDGDDGKGIHPKVQELIENSRNSYTGPIEAFPNDIETFLGVDKPKDNYRRPQRLVLKLKQGGVASERISELIGKINTLIKTNGPA